jgi:hypothetical protein
VRHLNALHDPAGLSGGGGGGGGSKKKKEKDKRAAAALETAAKDGTLAVTLLRLLFQSQSQSQVRFAHT